MMRSFAFRALAQAVGILAGIAAVGAVGLWFAQPLWRDVTVGRVERVRRWRPYLLPGGRLWCWVPDGWKVRQEERDGECRAVLQAGDTATVALVVGRWQASGEQGMRALQVVLESLRTRPGFWNEGPGRWEAGQAKGWTATAAYWRLAGLRPIAWYARLWAVDVGGVGVLAAAQADGQNFPLVAEAAERIVASLQVREVGRGRDRDEAGVR